MRTLNIKQIENVNGGGWQDALNCALGVASMVTAVAAAGAITGGWSIAAFAVGWLGGGINVALGCGQMAGG